MNFFLTKCVNNFSSVGELGSENDDERMSEICKSFLNAGDVSELTNDLCFIGVSLTVVVRLVGIICDKLMSARKVVVVWLSMAFALFGVECNGAE